MKENPLDLIKDGRIMVQSFDWLTNAYAKHTELTQEDIDLYFKKKTEKQKEKQNATS